MSRNLTATLTEASTPMVSAELHVETVRPLLEDAIALTRREALLVLLAAELVVVRSFAMHEARS